MIDSRRNMVDMLYKVQGNKYNFSKFLDATTLGRIRRNKATVFLT